MSGRKDCFNKRKIQGKKEKEKIFKKSKQEEMGDIKEL